MSVKTFLRDFVRGLRGPLDCAEDRRRKALEQLVSSTNFGKGIHADNDGIPPARVAEIAKEMEAVHRKADARAKAYVETVAGYGQTIVDSLRTNGRSMSRQATWIFVTDDPATWPSDGQKVAVCYERFKGWQQAVFERVNQGFRVCGFGGFVPNSDVKAWMPVYVPEEE